MGDKFENEIGPLLVEFGLAVRGIGPDDDYKEKYNKAHMKCLLNIKQAFRRRLINLAKEGL